MKTRTPLALLALTALILPLCACGSSSSDSGAGMREGQIEQGVDGALSSEAMDAAGEEAAAMVAEAEGEATAEASVIQTGWITIAVQDPADAVESVTAVAKDLGGYAENVSVEGIGESGESYADVTLRIPAASFDDAYAKIEAAEIGKVRGQGRSAADVTAQHVDLQARVAALEESVKRLSGLMASAETTSELIEAESALSERQQNLDGLRAQLEALEDQVDYATIQVSLSTESVLPSGPSNFWDGLLAGLDSIGSAGAAALILLGVALPWLVLVGALAGVIVLVVKASRKRK